MGSYDDRKKYLLSASPLCCYWIFRIFRDKGAHRCELGSLEIWIFLWLDTWIRWMMSCLLANLPANLSNLCGVSSLPISEPKWPPCKLDCCCRPSISMPPCGFPCYLRPCNSQLMISVLLSLSRDARFPQRDSVSRCLSLIFCFTLTAQNCNRRRENQIHIRAIAVLSILNAAHVLIFILLSPCRDDGEILISHAGALPACLFSFVCLRIW